MTGQVGTATPGDDRGHCRTGLGCGPKRGGRAGAGAEVGDGEIPEVRVVLDQTGDLDEAISKKIDVEDVGPVVLFFRGEQVEQHRGDASLVQYRGDVSVARTVTATSAAVCEHDHGTSMLGDVQMTAESIVSDLDLDVLVERSRVVVRLSGSSCRHGGGCCAVQAGDHFVVGGLDEVAVELPDCREPRWRAHADQLVGDSGHPIGPVERCHGDGEDHPTGSRSPCNLARSLGGRTGGDAVVDDDHDLSCQCDALAIGPVSACTTFEFGPLPALDGRQFVWCDAGHPDDLVIENPNAVFADGTHPQFRLERDTKFADQDHIEWGIVELART